MTCGFRLAWASPCDAPITRNGRCEKHADVKCVSCERPATQECTDTGGPFVCGYFLCDDCEHRGNTHAPKVKR